MPHISGWPWGFVEEVAFTLTAQFTPAEGYTVIQRPVRFMDPARTFSIFPLERSEPPNSKIIGQLEPLVKRYQYRAQSFMKHAVEAEGRALNALDAKMLEVVLYRDTTLAANLPTLSEELLGSRERFSRFGLGTSKYLNNEINGAYVFISQVDLWVESQTDEL